MQHHIVEVTPTIDTSAYSAADHLGTLMTLSGAVPHAGAGAVLRSVSVVDKAKQAKGITVLLFDASPTIASADNAALNITDAEMADKCIGHVSIVTGDYASISASAVATKACTVPVKAAAGSSTLYALAMSDEAPTYGSASDLVFRFHFTWEE